MKKFCGVLFLTVALLLAGSYDNRAEAYDKYVGTWRSGYDAYLMTETVRVINMNNFDCTVKAVRGRSVMFIHYNFYHTSNGWRFSNSDGVNNSVDNGTSIETNILYVVARDYGGIYYEEIF